ncbi:LOW QUALITY PROTEIN: hypothetical protein OSB04_016836 [Centaurea solstitialis]|uniref:CCHC-type domain-containing protein n=1 Tax=Centaurea solstitialis TaxID=347529 RepID=A0AA38TCS6_9ASTR|nr:LOW QUALITY PROTEIN: hypothetical protein OSB04_016836 [Centaurea solstitialis]
MSVSTLLFADFMMSSEWFSLVNRRGNLNNDNNNVNNCAEDRKVEYASCQLQGRALTWWNIQVQTRGRENAYRHSWEEFKGLLVEEYCPKSEIQKLEAKFWNHAMVGADIDRYTARFMNLRMPHMVTPESKRIDRYLWGLAPEIRGMVTSSNPTTIQAVVALATTLTNDAVRAGTLKLGSVGSKRKSKFQLAKRLQGNTRKGKQLLRAFGVKGQEVGRNSGNYPRCNQCNLHHGRACLICNLCKQKGHLARFCQVGKNTKIGGRVCYECGSLDHFRNVCPRLGRGVNNISTGNQARPTNQGKQGGSARGRAFVIGAEEARRYPEVVTCTFLLNDHYASVLFDTGADRCFVSFEFRPLINLKSKKLPTTYIVEVANGFELEAVGNYKQ